MARMFRSVVLCLLWGLAGGLVALVVGLAWVTATAASVEGSEAMGRAILVGYVLTPAGFLLGVVAGAVAIRRAGRRR